MDVRLILTPDLSQLSFVLLVPITHLLTFCVSPIDVKEKVLNTVAVHFEGIEGNRAGFPGHLNDILDRAVLVFYEPMYEQLREKFPTASSTLQRGGFGENLIVDHPSLDPAVVCIGDTFQIGSVRLVVTVRDSFMNQDIMIT